MGRPPRPVRLGPPPQPPVILGHHPQIPPPPQGRRPPPPPAPPSPPVPPSFFGSAPGGKKRPKLFIQSSIGHGSQGYNVQVDRQDKTLDRQDWQPLPKGFHPAYHL